jgi:trans-2-enoyl-CoA reductase
LIFLLLFSPNLSDITSRLRDLGADLVVTEETLASRSMRELILEKVGRLPRLGFNCVGGQSATEIARLLE